MITDSDIQQIRSEFPVLGQTVYGKPLVYLDNAATTQKPKCVIDKITEVYTRYNANVHRGVHYLSSKATDMMEQSRSTVRDFIGATNDHEIIFTRGTTESINLVAFSYGQRFVNQGDEIIISQMEHHSNMVPWQMLCERKDARLKIIPVLPDGTLDMVAYKTLLSEKTRLVAVTWVSNTLGTVNDIQSIIHLAHNKGIPVLIDAAQAVQHLPVSVAELDCDFLVFSAHKMYGPTGVGVLYGKEKWLEQMPPYQGGGEMIKTVSLLKSTYNDLPFKFEAGTPDYTAIIGMAEAINFINRIGINHILQWEKQMVEKALALLNGIDQVQVIGNASQRASVISFLLKNIHFYDTGMVLDKMGIAVRTGTHCTMPLMDFYKIDGTVRASFAIYNTMEEIEMLAGGLKKIIEIFK